MRRPECVTQVATPTTTSRRLLNPIRAFTTLPALLERYRGKMVYGQHVTLQGPCESHDGPPEHASINLLAVCLVWSLESSDDVLHRCSELPIPRPTCACSVSFNVTEPKRDQISMSG